MAQPVPASDGPSFHVAGFWRRALATIVDGAIVLPLIMLFGGVTAALAGHQVPRLGELGFGYLVHLAVDGGVAGAIAVLIGLLVLVLYQLVFLSTTGQTPGLRAVGLRVIDAYGDAPVAAKAAVRVGGHAVSILLFGLGCVWIAFSREKRALHDLLAGTYVVYVISPSGAGISGTASSPPVSAST